MKLDIGSFMFNMKINKENTNSTPQWGTELGQRN